MRLTNGFDSPAITRPAATEIEQVKATVERCHAGVIASQKKCLAQMAEAGKALLRLKNGCKHGQWMDIARGFSCDHKTITKYMRVAEKLTVLSRSKSEYELSAWLETASQAKLDAAFAEYTKDSKNRPQVVGSVVQVKTNGKAAPAITGDDEIAKLLQNFVTQCESMCELVAENSDPESLIEVSRKIKETHEAAGVAFSQAVKMANEFCGRW